MTMPNWLYEVINYPEDYQELGYILVLAGLVMLFIGVIWW
jgi:Mg2+ and Co2+ transporter CorA